MAAELARQLPTPNPLQLSTEQKLLVGEHLAKLLKSRVTYHHSGLSYGARAGVIEPLAKAGQLRVVVATMGLAAGINFSLRSVALAGESYRRDEAEQLLKPDELLQMFGRAGRRGLDETGFVLITANQLRLLDSHPCHLSRSGAVDWSALLGLMAVAAQHGRDPFRDAVRTQERLFTTKPIFLGVEESLRHPDVPCGLRTDAERARHVRKRVREMLNSRGEWETMREPMPCPCVKSSPRHNRHALTLQCRAQDPFPMTLQVSLPPSAVMPWRTGFTHHASSPSSPSPPPSKKSAPAPFASCPEDGHGRTYGRALTRGRPAQPDRVLLAKWIRRLTNWNGRQVPLAVWTADCPRRERETGAAEDSRRRISGPGPADRCPGQYCGPHPACARGPVRRCHLEACRARCLAGRLRPVRARPRLPPTARWHRCRLACGGGSAWWMRQACRPCAAASSASSPRATVSRLPPRSKTRPTRSKSWSMTSPTWTPGSGSPARIPTAGEAG